jgi:hypothetical protein
MFDRYDNGDSLSGAFVDHAKRGLDPRAIRLLWLLMRPASLTWDAAATEPLPPHVRAPQIRLVERVVYGAEGWFPHRVIKVKQALDAEISIGLAASQHVGFRDQLGPVGTSEMLNNVAQSAAPSANRSSHRRGVVTRSH